MAIKVLVTAIGQHLLADVKQLENQDTNELVAYWLRNAQLVRYVPQEGGNVAIKLSEFCPVANGAEFSVRVEHVVAILDPREDVLESYRTLVTPKSDPEEVVAIDPEVV